MWLSCARQNFCYQSKLIRTLKLFDLLGKIKAQDSYVWEEYAKVIDLQHYLTTKKQVLVTQGRARADEFFTIVENWQTEIDRIIETGYDVRHSEMQSIMLSSDWRSDS